MRFVPHASLMLCSVLLFACDTTCPAGKTRYGRKCVDKLAADAGDAGGGGSLEGGTDLDASAGEGDGDPDAASTECIPPTCDPCEAQPCLNDGVCSTTETAFECTCKVGFSGKTCEADVCELNPCEHGECTRKASGRTCKCEPGWEGDACETNTNASLASLTVSAGALYPAFKPNVFEYSVDLGISAPEVFVTPTVAVPDGVVMKLDGLDAQSGQPSELYALELNTSKVIPIEVTADDGTKATYRVTVRRSLVQQAYVKGGQATENGHFGGHSEQAGIAYSGSSVAADGDLLAVGHIAGQGIVELFARVNGSWSRRLPVDAKQHAQQGSFFGATVELSSDWLIVGAPNEASGAGAAYIMPRSTLGNVDAQVTRLTPGAAASNNHFGSAVAVGESIAVVAAFDEDLAVPTTGSGAVYVYRLGEEGWGEPSRLVSPSLAPEGKFGTSVALDGGRVFVGAPGDDEDGNPNTSEGRVYLFEYLGSSWQVTHTFQVAGAQQFGYSVAAGNGMLVTANVRACTPGCFGEPTLYVFRSERTSWNRESVVNLPAIQDTPSALDPIFFGVSGIAMSDHTIVVPAAYEFNSATGVNPAFDAIAEPAQGTGAVYVFVRHAGGWRPDGYLKASNAEGDDLFGMSVAATGDTVVIAAPGEASSASGVSAKAEDQLKNDADNAGAVYVFSTNCANVPAGASVPGC